MSHPSAATPGARPPRAAATILVVRPAAQGLEVLMLLRADKGDHNSGAWVFPGGLVDRGDSACHGCCVGLDDATASRLLGVGQGGLDYYVAAIRESFEEAGLLLALDASGQFPAPGSDAAVQLARQRGAVARGELDFDELCRDHGLRLATDRVHYIAHWVTPLGMAKRFDTRFFLALLPPGQQAAHDTVETLDHGWFRPADMLAAAETRKLLVVTQSVLRMLVEFEDVDALMRWAAAPRQVVRVERRRSRDARGPQVLMPDHPAWPEVGLLDPLGAGTASCELQPGMLVRLSPQVQRFTHEAGNSYLVGDAALGWVVIDPPPAHELAALLEATGGQAPRTLTTGGAAPGPVALGPGLTLQPVGGAWLLEPAGLLFTGQAAPTAAHRTLAQWAAPTRGFLVPLGCQNGSGDGNDAASTSGR